LGELYRREHVLKPTLHFPQKEGVQTPADCRIAVIGVGGVGVRTVTRLMEIGLTSAECIAVDTDIVHLSHSKASKKLLLGEKLTKGFGVRGDCALGRAVLEDSKKKVEDLLSGVQMVFVTASFSGGTGSGAAPVVARIARQTGAVTIGLVSAPFCSENGKNDNYASALAEMRRQCHTLVVIDNKRLNQLVPHQLPMGRACRVADQTLANVIKDVVETVSAPSLINLDFADFKTLVCHGGVAVVGVGEADTVNRAEDAVRNALKAPLMDVDCAGATGALIHVTGDDHLTVEEANHVGKIVTQMMHSDAPVIWGAKVNPEQEGRLKVTLLMTGVSSSYITSCLATAAPQLFNLEPHDEPEKSLDLKLNLYQMENF
jgi:cell division protein FtsZ